MDNHASHEQSVDPSKQVKVVEFPPDCISAHQSTEQDIIAALKRLYETDPLSAPTKSLECYERVRGQSEALKRPRGMVDSAREHQRML